MILCLKRPFRSYCFSVTLDQKFLKTRNHFYDNVQFQTPYSNMGLQSYLFLYKLRPAIDWEILNFIKLTQRYKLH
jgi:hypothetical protein